MKLSRKFWLITAILVILPATNATAQLSNPGNQSQLWDRSAAINSSRSVDVQTVVRKLIQPAALTDGKNTVQALIDLSLREDWPAPAREAAIYDFTRALTNRASHTVSPDILEYLSSYQAQILIKGEHRGVQPLFNIRAAAAGVENGWLRADSKQQALKPLLQNPVEWLAMYASARHPAQRSGYLDALKLANLDDIRPIQIQALQQLAGQPELTAVIATTISLNADIDAMHQLLLHARGAEIAPALNNLARVTNKMEQAALLDFAIKQSPAENAALAIASWGAALTARPETHQLLLDTLADPELGSSAALALANKANIQTIRELQLLSQGDGLAARRARLALEINRESIIQEQRR